MIILMGHIISLYISPFPALSGAALVDKAWVDPVCPVKWQWRDSNSQPPTTESEARALHHHDKEAQNDVIANFKWTINIFRKGNEMQF